MAQFLQNFADKLPHLAQRMLRGNAPFRVDVREHPALIEKSSTHRKSSRRISGKSESPLFHSGEVFLQTAKASLGGLRCVRTTRTWPLIRAIPLQHGD